MIIIMHGQFTREMPETVDKDKTWKWTRKGDLKVETGTLIFAAQEQALRTNYVRFNIDKSVDSPLCRLCGQKVGAPNDGFLQNTMKTLLRSYPEYFCTSRNAF